MRAVDCTLLGAPLSEEGIVGILGDRREDLQRVVSRLDVIDNHQAFILLRNAFSIPKLLYVLRASPAYLRPRELEVRQGSQGRGFEGYERCSGGGSLDTGGVIGQSGGFGVQRSGRRRFACVCFFAWFGG